MDRETENGKGVTRRAFWRHTTTARYGPDVETKIRSANIDSKSPTSERYHHEDDKSLPLKA